MNLFRFLMNKKAKKREYVRIPVFKMGLWCSTMEFTILPTGEVEQAVYTVFNSFDPKLQEALTFEPARGEWAERARFWKEVLKPALPPEQYRAAMCSILKWYTKCVRRYNEYGPDHRV